MEVAELTELLLRTHTDNRELRVFLREVDEEVVIALPDVVVSRLRYSEEAALKLKSRGVVEAALELLRAKRPNIFQADGEPRKPGPSWHVREGRKPRGGDIPIVVGSKHIHESALLCEVMARMISRADGYVGVPQFDTGSYLTPYLSLLTGRIDLYADYSGTVYEIYLEKSRDQTLQLQAQEQRSGDIGALAAELAETRLPHRALGGMNLAAPLRFGFRNNWQLLIRTAFVDEHGIAKQSSGVPLEALFDNREAWSALRVCGHEEFRRRSDGLAGMEKFVGSSVSSFEAAGPNQRYCVLASEDCDLIDGYETDPQIDALVKSGRALPVLDARGLLPEYNVLALTRASFVERYPEVVEALMPLHDVIKSEEMRAYLHTLILGNSSFENLCETGNYDYDLAKPNQPANQAKVRNLASRFIDELGL